MLVGDQYQLPPLVSDAAAKRDGMALSLFSRLAAAHPRAVCRLSVQYRMCAPIMRICNSLVYGNALTCGAQHVADAALIPPTPSKLPRARTTSPKWAAALMWAEGQSMVATTTTRAAIQTTTTTTAAAIAAAGSMHSDAAKSKQVADRPPLAPVAAQPLLPPAALSAPPPPLAAHANPEAASSIIYPPDGSRTASWLEAAADPQRRVVLLDTGAVPALEQRTSGGHVYNPVEAGAYPPPFHGLPRPSTAFHGLPRPSTACHGLPRPSTALALTSHGPSSRRCSCSARSLPTATAATLRALPAGTCVPCSAATRSAAASASVARAASLSHPTTLLTRLREAS